MFKFLRDLPVYYNTDGGGGGSDPTPPNPSPATVVIEDPKDKTIPKHRFDEVYGEMKTYKEKVAEFEKLEAERKAQAEEAEKKRLEETQQFQELYSKSSTELETAKKLAEEASAKAAAYEASLNTLVESELKGIDEKYHKLIPSTMNATEKLEWISNAKEAGILGKQVEIGTPTKIDPPKVDPKKMTAFDKIMAGMSKIDASKR